MDQNELWHDDLFDAIRTDVLASGGYKKVGSELRPSMKPNKSGEWLADCLNRDRAAKLDPEDLTHIKRLAKQKNSFATIYFEMDEIGMSHPTPIEPEDERAKLQREFIESQKHMERLINRMSGLQSDGDKKNF